MKDQIKLLNAYEMFGSGHCDYGVNSQGYRCPEFEAIDWRNSILIFGCSHVFGIGLEDHETVANQLSLLLNTPVINLGQGGTSSTFQWINSTILRKFRINPKAVIYIWPEDSRQTIFYSNDVYKTNSVGFWSVGDKPDYTQLGIGLVLDPYHAKTIAKYQRDNVNVLWNCPVLHFSFTQETDDVTQLKGMLDIARDGFHSGPISNKSWAKVIASKLNWKR
jgi:hypothetical protein